MRKLVIPFIGILISLFATTSNLYSQAPCSGQVYRQFDFWIGDWEVFGKNGSKAGDSHIELILDSCIILENWKSATATKGIYYSGKSFNTYNASTGQWQQTWVDNVGGTTEYLKGAAEQDKVIFHADNQKANDGKIFQRRLTFHRLSKDKVRQHGERSNDGGKTWTTDFDLEYRRRG